MTTPTGPIGVTFQADNADPVIRAVQELGRQLQTLKGREQQASSGTLNLSQAFGVAKSAAAAFGVGLSLVQLVQFARDTVEATARLHDLAQQTGLTAEQLSVLRVAAGRAGLDTDALGGIAKNLSRSLEELKQGSSVDVVQAFQAIGLSAKDFQNLDLQQSFKLIADAQAKYADGTTKNLIAQRLFGREGATLIPLLNELAGDGLAKVTEQAHRMSAVVSTEAADAANKFEAELSDLNLQAKGLAGNLSSGILPPLTKFLEILGKIAAFAGTKGDLGGAVAGALQNLPGGLGVLAGAFFSSGLGAIPGLAGTAASGAAGGARDGRPTPTIPNIALIQAQLAARRAAAQQALAIEQRRNESERQLNEAQFEQGLEGLGLFFQRRLGLIREATAAEIASLETQRAAIAASPVLTPQDAQKQRADLAAVDAQITQRRIEGATQENALLAERVQAEKQAGQARLGFEQKILEAQGQTVSAAIIGAELEVRAFRDLLAKQGITGDAQDVQARGLEQVLVARAQITDLQTQASRALADLDRQRQAIVNAVTVGTLTEIQGQQRIAELEASRLPALRQIAAAALATAQALGDPAAIAAAQQLGQELDNLAASADLSAQRAAQLTEGLIQAGESNLGQFFANLATNVTAAGDVFRSFFQSILADLARLEAQFLASSIFRAILSAGAAAGGVSFGGGFGHATEIGPLMAAGGGTVPGIGNRDTVPIMATPGEHILTTREVAMLGRDGLALIKSGLFMPALRRFGGIQHFNGGGTVGPAASSRTTLDGAVEIIPHPDAVVRVLRGGAFLRVAAENRRELRDIVQNSGF